MGRCFYEIIQSPAQHQKIWRVTECGTKMCFLTHQTPNTKNIQRKFNTEDSKNDMNSGGFSEICKLFVSNQLNGVG